jgi:hypothetical protein
MAFAGQPTLPILAIHHERDRAALGKDHAREALTPAMHRHRPLVHRLLQRRLRLLDRRGRELPFVHLPSKRIGSEQKFLACLIVRDGKGIGEQQLLVVHVLFLPQRPPILDGQWQSITVEITSRLSVVRGYSKSAKG